MGQNPFFIQISYNRAYPPSRDNMEVQQESIEQLIEDLKTSNKVQQLLLDNCDEAHFFYTMERKPVYVSSAFEKITGYTAQELYDAGYIDYVHPDDRQRINALYEGTYNGESFENVEFRIVKKDGEMRWNASSWKPVLDSDGRQIGIQGKQQDISKRKQAQEIQFHTYERFNVALKNSPIVVFNQDLNLYYTWIYNPNPGFNESDVIGKTDAELLPKGDADRLTKTKLGVIESGIGTREEVMTTIGGTPYYYDLSVEPLRDLTGRIIGITCSSFNITEHKRTEAALRDSEEGFRGYFENVAIGTAKVNQEGLFILVNDRYCEIVGYSREELLDGMGPLDLDHPDDREKDSAQLDEYLAGKSPDYITEKRYLRKDGEIVWVRVSAAAVYDEAGGLRFSAGVIEDITERKQAEAAMEKLLDQNRKLTRRLFQVQEQERRHLARELHDEYGQWLTALRMHAHILDDHCGDRDVEMRDSITNIAGISSKMHQSIRRMIHELLPVELDELGLIDCLQELVNNWRARYPQIRCTLSLEGSLSDFDVSLNVKLYRIVQESLTNVARHAMADNVSILLRQYANQSMDADYLLLTIDDDGRGADLDMPNKGIGLAGMRERVLAVGGEFVLKSTHGSGFHLEIRLPVAKSREEIEG